MWLRLALRFPVGYLAVLGRRLPRPQPAGHDDPRGRGKQQFRLVEQIEGLLATAPNVQPDRRHLRRRRAGAHLSAALDALRTPTGARLAAHLARACEDVPGRDVDPRTPAALAGFVLGAVAAGRSYRLRFLVLRKGLRVHLRR